MKSDLPRLMKERNLDALFVFGPDGMNAANAPFTYFIGDAHVSRGWVLIKRDGDTVRTTLLCGGMERDEAAKTGLNIALTEPYNLPQIIRDKKGNRLSAQIEFIKRIFEDHGIDGRVGFYGTENINKSFTLMNEIAKEEFCEIVSEYENDVITAARMTKDAEEAGKIRATCRLTEHVIGATRDYLRSHRVESETLIKPDGNPLTIGDAKDFIRRESFTLGLDLGDCIFSIGRDSAIGHSSGTRTDFIMRGKTIVFDIFPRGSNGYFSDITRTWCIGHAPEHVHQAHALVLEAHQAAEAGFKLGRPTHEMQDVVCDIFEKAGHSTQRTNYGSMSGYYHGLGHGFGLEVHEAPGMGLKETRPLEHFQRGTIICNEPGLYYPDDPRGGWGVRIEDDYWFDENGKVERLTEFDRGLII
jgi:Xaa-Pro aminopeptidase